MILGHSAMVMAVVDTSVDADTQISSSLMVLGASEASGRLQSTRRSVCWYVVKLRKR